MLQNLTHNQRIELIIQDMCLCQIAVNKLDTLPDVLRLPSEKCLGKANRLSVDIHTGDGETSAGQ